MSAPGLPAPTPAGRGPAAAGLAGAALAGAVMPLAQAAPGATAAWALPLLAAALLAVLVAGQPPRRAALRGWVFATAWGASGTWWLFVSMHRYGGLPAPLAVAAVGLLSAFLAVYLGAALGWAARRAGDRPLADATRFAAAWLAAELARGQLFTGFPWVASGYGQVDGPLAALAPWIGVYGIGALLAWSGAALGLGLRAAWRGRGAGGAPATIRPRQAAAAVAAALALPLAAAGLGRWGAAADFTAPAGTLRVALLQTNVAQDEKFATEHLPATLAWLGRALVEARADLVVAPETAVPLLPDQLAGFAPGYWDGLVRHFGQPGGPAALVGVPLGSESSGYTNSVHGLSAAMQAAGAPYRYDKSHLVPFGEFIPRGFRWFTELMNIPLGDFDRGPLNAPSFAVAGQRVAPNICYEDLFGEELARRFADPARAPTLLANLSNIGWFGDTAAVPQHLAIARLRSLELQRTSVRATNTGATAVIDHRGVVTARLAPFTQGVLLAEVQGRQGRTPYARWAAAAGLWPLWALALAGLAWPASPGRRGAPGGAG